MKNKLITFSAGLLCISLHVTGQTPVVKKPLKKPASSSRVVATKPNTATIVTTEKVTTPSTGAEITSPVKTKQGLRFTFGIRAGVQSNALLVRQKTNDLSATVPFAGFGFHGGGVADARFNESFSVQAQLLAASKSTSFSKQNKFTLITVDLPLNFLYHKQGFYMGGGPFFSYGLKAQHDDKQNAQNYDLYAGTPSPLLNLWKRLEIGAGVTMGYEFENGLSVNAVYNRGFSNIYKKQDVPDVPIDNISTNVVSFALGYTFK